MKHHSRAHLQASNCVTTTVCIAKVCLLCVYIPMSTTVCNAKFVCVCVMGQHLTACYIIRRPAHHALHIALPGICHSCPWDPTDNIWNAMDTNHHGDHGVQTVKHIVDQGWVPMCDLQQQCMIKLMRMKGSCDSCTYYVPHDTDKLG